ncbi:MAG: glutamine--fructose-6-phosphate transaminase (isomerizing) [Candidatus Nomurabacteria bacterium]|nr:MAG: glutamine--fructose-6-phosphate transaminase (isomerizing) [Candidatus Nomurabacteria bacterium]
MCGIIGYTGSRSALPLLFEGIESLQHRGYDSGGVGLQTDSSLTLIRALGKPENLSSKLEERGHWNPQSPAMRSRCGIGHTRWATHGEPSVVNAHPHASRDGHYAVVHNGTIDNLEAIRKQLLTWLPGLELFSETDTELLAHMVMYFVDKEHDLIRAVQLTGCLIEGANAFAVISSRNPGCIAAFRRGSPLLFAKLEHGYLLASDQAAILPHSSSYSWLEDGDVLFLSPDEDPRVLDADDYDVVRESINIEESMRQSSRGDHPHFMLAEIMGQPVTIQRTIEGRIQDGGKPLIRLGGMIDIREWVGHDLSEILLTGCGTSWFAAQVGKRWLNQLGFRAEAPLASELFRSFQGVDRGTLVIPFSQSGETHDTNQAVKWVKERDAKVWSICNVVGSALTRMSNAGMYLRVGQETGVASTKAFTSQVVAATLTGLALVQEREPDRLHTPEIKAVIQAILDLPRQIQNVLDQAAKIREVAESIASSTGAYFLGTGYSLCAAREGALKLKEISYIHAEAYPVAEMKHGPIALIDENMPVIFVAVDEGGPKEWAQSLGSNISEVRARKGQIIVIAEEDSELAGTILSEGSGQVLYTPKTVGVLTPVLSAVVMQLLAYYAAAELGREIDQPRNLAKVVTVA